MVCSDLICPYPASCAFHSQKTCLFLSGLLTPTDARACQRFVYNEWSCLYEFHSIFGNCPDKKPTKRVEKRDAAFTQ